MFTPREQSESDLSCSTKEASMQASDLCYLSGTLTSSHLLRGGCIHKQKYCTWSCSVSVLEDKVRFGGGEGLEATEAGGGGGGSVCMCA